MFQLLAFLHAPHTLRSDPFQLQRRWSHQGDQDVLGNELTDRLILIVIEDSRLLIYYCRSLFNFLPARHLTMIPRTVMHEHSGTREGPVTLTKFRPRHFMAN